MTGLLSGLFYWMTAKKAGVFVKVIPSVEFFPRGSDGPFIGNFPMNRTQLEHILRAAGSVSGSREIVVIGSQAILASYPDAPSELLKSMEADVYPLDVPEKADLIDGCIGELSPFHETFGYYAHGVSPDTATLPRGWRSRLVKLENQNTEGTVGWCLAPVDLAASKLVAGREKDLDFVRGMFRVGILSKLAVRKVFEELIPDQASVAGNNLESCV